MAFISDSTEDVDDMMSAEKPEDDKDPRLMRSTYAFFIIFLSIVLYGHKKTCLGISEQVFYSSQNSGCEVDQCPSREGTALW